MALEINDEQALTQASEGDRDSFGVLYDRYVVRIYNYIYYRTGNQHGRQQKQEQEILKGKVMLRESISSQRGNEHGAHHGRGRDKQAVQHKPPVGQPLQQRSVGLDRRDINHE